MRPASAERAAGDQTLWLRGRRYMTRESSSSNVPLAHQNTETDHSMTCKIIAHASTRYVANYRVLARGKVYEVRVEDPPGEDCAVRVEGLEEGSELFRSIEGTVLKDWLGIDPIR
jgi:hypothetical protein